MTPGFELTSQDHGLDHESSTFTTRPGGFPYITRYSRFSDADPGLYVLSFDFLFLSFVFISEQIEQETNNIFLINKVCLIFTIHTLIITVESSFQFEHYGKRFRPFVIRVISTTHQKESIRMFHNYEISFELLLIIMNVL